MCEVELTPDEASLALNALNDASLGLGTLSAPSGSGVATETAIATATEIGTATQVGTAA
jgi:hypothetical protein